MSKKDENSQTGHSGRNKSKKSPSSDAKGRGKPKTDEPLVSKESYSKRQVESPKERTKDILAPCRNFPARVIL